MGTDTQDRLTLWLWLFAGTFVIGLAYRLCNGNDKGLSRLRSERVSPALYPVLFMAACAGPVLGGNAFSPLMLVMGVGLVAFVYGLLWVVHRSGIVGNASVPTDTPDP
jgi:hypothetical protein